MEFRVYFQRKKESRFDSKDTEACERKYIPYDCFSKMFLKDISQEDRENYRCELKVIISHIFSDKIRRKDSRLE